MTTPCENKDDIKTLHTKVDRLADSFNTFRLNASVDIATLKADSKRAGGRAGGVWGAIVVILLALADWAMRG